jgi:6-phosphogluconolactonase
MPPQVSIAPTPAELARQVADSVCSHLAAAIERHGEGHLVLTGGSTPIGLYANLRREPWRDQVDWTRVVIWMGDDRFVPSGDPNSNAGMAQRMLLDETSDAPALPVLPENVCFFPIDQALHQPDGQSWAAAQYANELRRRVPETPPALDVVLLGLGSDGHILSVFPESPAAGPGAPLVMAIPAPTHIEPKLPRLTLNPSLLRTARRVILIAQGESKAAVVEKVLRRPYDPVTLPGQFATGDNAHWFLDAAAASIVTADIPQ